MCSSNINVLTNLHQRLCISNQLPGDPVLLVWGPHFEYQGSNALSNTRDSFNPEELRSQSGVPFSFPGSEGEERMGRFPMGWVSLDRLPGHSGICFLVCKAWLAAGRTRLSGQDPNPPPLPQASHRSVQALALCQEHRSLRASCLSFIM